MSDTKRANALIAAPSHSTRDAQCDTTAQGARIGRAACVSNTREKEHEVCNPLLRQRGAKEVVLARSVAALVQ